MASLPHFPDRAVDQPLVLGAGELYFGHAPGVVHTLLGSCVAITLWHPRLRCGGMCHYLLPRREDYVRNQHQRGHYASDAIDFFVREAKRLNCSPGDFQVKLFGGGQMFDDLPGADNPVDVAGGNIAIGLEMLKEGGFRVRAADTGGVRYRKIFLDLSSGDVWVQYGKYARTDPFRTVEQT